MNSKLYHPHGFYCVLKKFLLNNKSFKMQVH